MRLVNLTPHPVNVYGDRVFPIYSLPKCTNPARLVTKDTNFEKQIKRREFVGVECLPAPKDGVVYVVSNKLRIRLPERKDLASPNGEIRDPKTNEVIGCI